MSFHAVSLAGGSGTRLWPVSRAGNPKFLHPLTGSSATLLQATLDRLSPLAPPSRTYVVTGVAHATDVARQASVLPAENILVEPLPRDSCAAVGLAASIIARRDPDAIMGSFATDHLVRDNEQFIAVVRAAIEGAAQGLLMTIGITPTRPETGYGYLQCGEMVAAPVRRVQEFKEKPSAEVASEYVASGRYLWNAGMFVWRVDAFLAELARQQPELHAGLATIADAWGTDQQDAVLGQVWSSLPKISVDYGVMEGAAEAGFVATVPGDFGWNDVGDFNTLAEVLPADAYGNVVLAPNAGKPDVLLHDTTGSVVVPHGDRLIAVLGMRDVVVVDTPDVVCVCPRDRAQEVKAAVDELK
ncbi:MAG TPA: mannose-1-phosphate guanylyltransferase, partial [Micromonosporaceae bacterium]